MSTTDRSVAVHDPHRQADDAVHKLACSEAATALRGMAGGGEGECQVSGGGTIHAMF